MGGEVLGPCLGARRTAVIRRNLRVPALDDVQDVQTRPVATTPPSPQANVMVGGGRLAWDPGQVTTPGEPSGRLAEDPEQAISAKGNAPMRTTKTICPFRTLPLWPFAIRRASEPGKGHTPPYGDYQERSGQEAECRSIYVGRVRRSALPLPTAAVIFALLLAGCGSAGTASAVHGSSSNRPAQSVLAYNRSCDKTAVSQIAMDDCVTGQFHQVERQLSKALTQEKDSVAQGLVNAAESSFQTFEAAECRAEASPNLGGTIYPSLASKIRPATDSRTPASAENPPCSGRM